MKQIYIFPFASNNCERALPPSYNLDFSGPICWSFSCAEGHEKCIEKFNEAEASPVPLNSMSRAYGKLGVCSYIRTYFDRDSGDVIGDHVTEDGLFYVLVSFCHWSFDFYPRNFVEDRQLLLAFIN